MTDRKPRWSLEAAPPESGQAQAAGGAGRTVRLLGAWSLIAFVPHGRALAAELSALARDPGVGCALREVDPLDRAGAVLLWRVWGRRTPARLALRPARMPWKEISANLYRTGSQAAGIAALVGFLIGIVLSCLSGKQLQQWVPDVFIVNLPGIAVIRERGPVLAAILVAGRSGSAITAQIGVMRVTQELDAMTVMGIPHDRRLILPRAIALAIAMPLLILWTSAMALIGGMPAAEVELGLNHSYFIDSLRTAVPIANCWMGLGKGVVFGILLAALVAVAVWFRQDAVVRDRYLLVAASSVSGLDVQASLRLRGAAIGSVFGGTRRATVTQRAFGFERLSPSADAAGGAAALAAASHDLVEAVLDWAAETLAGRT